ncbi:MAG: hypothetical protein ACKVP2_01345, partial [Burkholderiales bacterium]
MKRRSTSNRILVNTACVLALGFVATTVSAALTDIATAPMATSSTAVVKPNLMFILDASGSMNRDYMPDWVDDDAACKRASATLTDCDYADPPFNSSAFNTIYYNPATTYTPAVNYDGTSRTSYTTWTAVPNDAYGVQFTGTIDLTTAYPDNVWCNTGSPSTADRTPPFASGVCRLPIVAGVWTYPNATHNQRFTVTGTRNPFYYTISSLAWCSTANATGFGNGTCQPKKTATYRFPKYGTASDGFTRVDILSSTANYPRANSRTDCTGTVGPTGCSYAQEMTNFANWYAYYRTRMQMMKTSSGLAFKQVTDNFRVGFITINPGSPVASANYLPMGDFAAGAGGQKNLWYNKFYAQDPNDSTPLREALARVGRYYAKVTTGINSGMSDDPVQYSCQQNFALLSTDGFWNGNDGQKLDGTAVGNQDNDPSTTVRPILDASADITTVTTNSSLSQQICTGNNTVFGATTCGCTGADAGKRRVKQQTASSVLTVVTRDFVVVSSTPSNPTTYQNITSCDATVVTTVTPVTRVEEQKVVGTNNTTFAAVNGVAAGANATGSCASVGLANIKRRTTTYDQTVISIDGVPGAPTFSNTIYAFADVGACVAVNTVQNFSVSETTRYVAPEANPGPTAFAAAANGANPQTTYTCSGSGVRTTLLERTIGYNKTVTTNGAAAPVTTFPGAPALTSGPTYVLNNTCSTTAKTTSNTVTPTLVSTTITGGPVPAATTTINGAPSSTTTGST